MAKVFGVTVSKDAPALVRVGHDTPGSYLRVVDLKAMVPVMRGINLFTYPKEDIKQYTLVDPAQLFSMYKQLGGLGASGAMYKRLGIRCKFSQHLKDKVTKEGEAAYVVWEGNLDSDYERKETVVSHVIHTVGPRCDKFMDSNKRRDFWVKLVSCYNQIFAAYLNKEDRLPKLRLLPVSGSIFCRDDPTMCEIIHKVTAVCVKHALCSLHPDQLAVLDGAVEMHIFDPTPSTMEAAFDNYDKAFKDGVVDGSEASCSGKSTSDEQESWLQYLEDAYENASLTK